MLFSFFPIPIDPPWVSVTFLGPVRTLYLSFIGSFIINDMFRRWLCLFDSLDQSGARCTRCTRCCGDLNPTTCSTLHPHTCIRHGSHASYVSCPKSNDTLLLSCSAPGRPRSGSTASSWCISPSFSFLFSTVWPRRKLGERVTALKKGFKGVNGFYLHFQTES